MRFSRAVRATLLAALAITALQLPILSSAAASPGPFASNHSALIDGQSGTTEFDGAEEGTAGGSIDLELAVTAVPESPTTGLQHTALRMAAPTAPPTVQLVEDASPRAPPS